MTQPDWAVTVFQGARVEVVNGTSSSSSADSAVSDSKLRQFQDQGQNIAKKDELASGSTPVSGAAVTGTVQTNAVSVAPATSVSIADTNLLIVQNFNDANTVAQHGQWTWFGDDGHITLGCARWDYNGSGQDDLVSNEVSVVPSEKIQVTVWVKWSDLTYTGSAPVVLGVEKYRKARDAATGNVTYLDVGGTDVVALNSPAADGDWKQLTGTYTVPTSGVDQVRARLRVKGAVTAGAVLWDEIELKKLDLIPDAAVPGIGNANDNVVNNLQGQPGTGYTSDDVAKAYQNTASALTAANAKIAVIDATGGSGSVAADDFSWTGEIIASANWAGYYTETSTWGTYSANGSDAVWNPPTSTANRTPKAVFAWAGTGATSTTDYQKINLVLDGAIGGNAYVYAGVYLIGRMSSDFSTYVRLQINGNNTANIWKVAGGTETQLGSNVTISAPGTGTSIDFWLGIKDTTEPDRFKAFINGVQIMDVTDTGATSSGAAYRHWGWGGYMSYQPSYAVPIPFTFNGYYWYGNYWVNPPPVNQWIAQDQT